MLKFKEVKKFSTINAKSQTRSIAIMRTNEMKYYLLSDKKYKSERDSLADAYDGFKEVLMMWNVKQ
ncbi:hypothetical protein ABE82_26730 (plasmid) [Paenibacillus peoriae]|uniref:hypothetical protein n=1 Tax=Paenibacillus peoriae TaxID=59893 RepID=UPI0007205DC7|nr:hypothetical protein [Paenibacillus peoriae]ALS10008.1 hypothetical protein ABE82_26730 [Paenibacillus peoriae]